VKMSTATFTTTMGTFKAEASYEEVNLMVLPSHRHDG
jgi:hypothetical protein